MPSDVQAPTDAIGRETAWSRRHSQRTPSVSFSSTSKAHSACSSGRHQIAWSGGDTSACGSSNRSSPSVTTWRSHPPSRFQTRACSDRWTAMSRSASSRVCRPSHKSIAHPPAPTTTRRGRGTWRRRPEEVEKTPGQTPSWQTPLRTNRTWTSVPTLMARDYDVLLATPPIASRPIGHRSP